LSDAVLLLTITEYFNMRITIFQSLALIGVASAASIVQRSHLDVTSIIAAIGSMNTSFLALDATVLSLTPQSDIPSAIATVTDEGTAILAAINGATADVQNSEPLSTTAIFSLIKPASDLGTTANTTLYDIIGKHDILVNAGEATFIISELNAMKAATNPFIAALVAKVPTAAQSTVQSYGNQVITALNTGILAYGGSVTRRAH
jgi:hypothetical protein